MSLVEKVARALSDASAVAAKQALHELGDDVMAKQAEQSIAGWDDQPEAWKTAHRSMARAAIAAMREPTVAMIEVGDATHFDWCQEPGDGSPHGWIWKAMIDAAVRGGTE